MKNNSNNSILNYEQLQELTESIRYTVTDIICKAGGGHLGGSLSLVDILITLYYRIMNVDPENPGWEDRDRFILSKGHAGPVLYAILAELGFFPKELLYTINKNGTRLTSHVDQNYTPGIEVTAGSLGQGLSCAVGIAKACKLDKRLNRVFCVIGDGESQEGQIWEAAMFAANHKLDNLVVITDYNRLQLDGRTDEIISLEPLADKWSHFGWEVFEMNGHNLQEIYSTINQAVSVNNKPSMIVAHTIKGKDNSLIEDRVESHYIVVPDEETYDNFLNGLQ